MISDLHRKLPEIIHYYRNPAILHRILEFCGIPTALLKNFFVKSDQPLAELVCLKELLCAASAEYISAYGFKLLEKTKKDHASMKIHCLGWVLDNGLDVHRSIWDKDNVIGVLDMELFSKSYPAEPYSEPQRTFDLLEPVYQSIYEALSGYGLSPHANATGQGYNFAIFIRKSAPIFNEVVTSGFVERSLKYDYSHPSPKRGRPVPEQDGMAFDIMGKVFEYLCHKVMCNSRHTGSPVPLVIGDIVCGNEKREAISLDLSLYGNPLHTRSIRFPFSAYSKHLLKTKGEDKVIQEYLYSIPRTARQPELSLKEVLETRINKEKTIKLASTIQTTLPDDSDGFARLFQDYKNSELHAFHQQFDSTKINPKAEWPKTYDRLDLESIPPCAAQPLLYPNPLLLQPTGIRHLVRVLMADGWHPKHVAGLICTKYARDYDWEVNFTRYDALRWASVWVRIYAGLILCGIDRLIDLNCVSQQEKGDAWPGFRYCPKPWCGFNLADYRGKLLKRL